MPKIKTSRGAAKRFKVTGTGKIRRAKAYRRHNFSCKTRFCLRVLQEKLCRRYAFARRIFPVPVTLKRFAAPRDVLIFGIVNLPFLVGRVSDPPCTHSAHLSVPEARRDATSAPGGSETRPYPGSCAST